MGKTSREHKPDAAFGSIYWRAMEGIIGKMVSPNQIHVAFAFPWESEIYPSCLSLPVAGS